MANTITGRVHRILPIENGVTKGGKAFKKRNIVLDCTRFDPYTGERDFDNFPSFDFFNEKCEELNQFQQGQVVTIHFNVVGSYYEPNDKYITNVKPYKIELFTSKRVNNTIQQPTQQSAQTEPAIQQPRQSSQPNTPQGVGDNNLPF